MAIGQHVAKARQEKAAAEAPEIEQPSPEADAFAEALIAEAETPAAPMTMTMDQFLEALKAVKGSGFDEAALTRVLVATQQANATASANAMQTALNRSNPNYVAKSPFHYEDGREAVPIYTVYMGPQHTKGKGVADPKFMYSPAECDLINRFVIGERKVARGGDWTAEAVRDGSTQELHIKVPMTTMDQRQNLPSLVMILTELLDGEVATNPDKLMDLVLAQGREIERLKAQHAASAA